MEHLKKIKAFIKTLMNSGSFHALVVQSPPGWGKSTTIDLALNGLGISPVIVGAYATPLHIYNTFCQNPNSIIVFDDCAGLFNDTKSMAILKAATWDSCGQEITKSSQKTRRIAWGSTSDKVDIPFTDFSGKIILLTNVVPGGKETEAFLSRCLSYPISFGKAEIKQLLLSAAASQEHFEKIDLAIDVAQFLISKFIGDDLFKINFRTLKMGYELAITHPDSWRELFGYLLPMKRGHADPILEIFRSELPVKEQLANFQSATGMGRRSYYNYKKRLSKTHLNLKKN